MLGWRRLLLGGLLAAGQAAAVGVRIEPLPPDRGARLSVSWELPAGFDESELVLEIAGGPRVRLTGEIRSRNPRVEVALPHLAGLARLVVRAGRDGDDVEHRGLAERDVAYSKSFALASAPARSARTPVRAAPSRPAPGREMEWWSEPPSAGLEGPGDGLSASRVADGTLDPDRLHIKKRRRAASAAHSSCSTACARPPGRVNHPSRAPGSRSFSGAAVPLRN